MRRKNNTDTLSTDIYNRCKQDFDVDLLSILDPNPLPSEQAAYNIDGSDNIDGVVESSLERSLRVLSLLPSKICHEMLLYVLGESTATNLKEVAELCNMSYQGLYKNISKAKSMTAYHPMLGSSQESLKNGSLRRGHAVVLTNDVKGEKAPTKKNRHTKKAHGEKSC